MQEDDFKKIKHYFPNKDDALIRELMTECRDINDVLSRLGNDDESANWKKNEPKKQKLESGRSSKNGVKHPRVPRENKTPPPPAKKAKEPAGALLQKKKQPDFGPASNATWGDIKFENGDIVSTAKPAQPAQPEPKPAQTQEKAAAVQPKSAAPSAQQPSKEQNQNNNKKQISHDINPENIQQPQSPQQSQTENQTQTQTTTQNEKPQRPKNASLFLPVSLNNVTPDLSKFGIFAGPLPQEAPTKRTPKLALFSDGPTFVGQHRPKVFLSNQYHHFEVQRPPSPPPQPKVQPPVSVNIETQTQKEEQTTEIQQQQQQQAQIPVPPVNNISHVAPVQPTSVGPVGSQPLFVNYAYPPFGPFAYQQYDPNAAQQPQQPVAFVQYSLNQGAYPFPFATLPPGYQPMAAPIPQGAQQPQPSQPQNQQQPQQQNQRQMQKNYNNRGGTYTHPMHQSRTNGQYP